MPISRTIQLNCTLNATWVPKTMVQQASNDDDGDGIHIISLPFNIDPTPEMALVELVESGSK